MKTKRNHCMIYIALLFLLIPGFNSCEVFYCEQCTNGEETFWECSQNAIDMWESSGYSCE